MELKNILIIGLIIIGFIVWMSKAFDDGMPNKDERIKKLENEIKDLKREINKLKERKNY